MARVAEKKKVKNEIEYFFDRICVGTNIHGRKKYKDIYAKTAAELKEKRKKIQRLVDEGVKVGNKQSFNDFFNSWLFTVHFVELKPSSKERYESVYRNYIKNSQIGLIKLDKINSIVIQEYYNSLVVDKGKSTSTIKTINKLMKPCLKYAYNEGYTIRDFGQSLRIPKNTGLIEDNKKYPVFTLEEQQKFILGLDSNRLKTLFLIALGTGLRQGELLALTWNDIDFENKILNVNKSVKRVTEIDSKGQKGKSKFIIQTPKTKSSIRQVPIPQNLIKELMDHKERQKKENARVYDLYIDNNLVFCTEFGKIIDARNLIKKYRKVLESLSIEYKKFHSLRHTYATRLFEADVPMKTVQVLLGHSNIKQTMDIYTHVMEEVKFDAVDKIDSLF